MSDVSPRLLFLKYHALKLPHLVSPSDLTRIGWNIRKKYARHASSQEEKEQLLAFADRAIDKGVYDHRFASAVNRALLNAQKWRYDPENLSVDPQSRKEWRELEDLSSSVVEHAALGSKYLKEVYNDFRFFDENDTRIIFYRSIVLNFLSRIYKIQCRNLDIKILRESSLGKLISDQLTEVIELVPFHQLGDEDILEQFGLRSNFARSQFKDEEDDGFESKVRLTFERLHTEKLFIVEDSLIGQKAVINLNHPLAKRISEERGGAVEILLTSLAEAQIALIGDDVAVSRFISFFSCKCAEHLNGK